MFLRLGSIAILSLSAAVAGCAHQAAHGPDQAPVYSAGGRGGSASASLGVVSAIDRVSSQDQLSGAGAVIGGVTGAVIGRQFGGSGDGRAMGTWLGAVAGLLIGNEVERQRSNLRDAVRVSVQLDSGAVRRFDMGSAGDLRVGDRVRVEDNRVFRM